MNDGSDELVFAPLGGLGEIGMNLALYGFGRKGRIKWLMVDCGVAFAGPDLPGSTSSFRTSASSKRCGVIWRASSLPMRMRTISARSRICGRSLNVRSMRRASRLRFSKRKRLAEPGAPEVPITVVAQGASVAIGPFEVEFIAMAHSIPESCALAIRTPLGTVLHSGDWKIDAAPGIGKPTDAKRLAAIGAEGVLALISDSTNILREGVSPSEADVAKTLREIIGKATGRVVVTTFASNVARIRAVAEAAVAAGRTVVMAGRAMERVTAVARECGYLDGIPEFLSQDAFAHLPRDKVVFWQPEARARRRAAIARMSRRQSSRRHAQSRATK